MPTISSPNLTLTGTDGQVTVRVRYDATFTPFDRQLAGLGLNYHSHVTMHGIGGAAVGPTLADVTFPHHNFDVTEGTTNQVLPGDESVTVPRSALQEDPVDDADEVKCEIRVHSPVPPVFTDSVFTDQESLTSR